MLWGYDGSAKGVRKIQQPYKAEEVTSRTPNSAPSGEGASPFQSFVAKK